MIEVLIKFIAGGLIYLGIEVVWDGTTDRRMGLVGGLAFIICGQYDKLFNLPTLIIWALVGSIIVLLEYISGSIWNKDYNIWDYRKYRFNLHGQVCLEFFLLWCFPFAPLIIWAYNII